MSFFELGGRIIVFVSGLLHNSEPRMGLNPSQCTEHRPKIFRAFSSDRNRQLLSRVRRTLGSRGYPTPLTFPSTVAPVWRHGEGQVRLDQVTDGACPINLAENLSHAAASASLAWVLLRSGSPTERTVHRERR